ncbi:MAG: hypothetical protein QG558_597 [Campylobacterota bacterium]|nr:hypothetical protein [Campylobacterota bacterium]
MKNSKQAIKAISLLWIGSLLGAGCAFVTQVILARQLGPSEFGIFATALATVTLVMPLAGFGIAQYWLKVFGQEGWAAIRFLSPSFRFVVVSTVATIMLLTGWAILGPHDVPQTIMMLVLSFYLIGQVSVELVSSKLQLEERYVSLAAWQFFPHFIRFMIVMVMSLWLSDLVSSENIAYAYAFAAIGFAVLGSSPLYRMFRGHFDLKGHGDAPMRTFEQAKSSFKTVASHSWPFGMAGLFHLIYFQSAIILVKYMSGEEAAGMYNVAFTVMVAVLLFPSIVYQKFLLPKMHRWANHDRKRFYQVYRQGNVIMMILGIVAMLMIWAIAPWGVPMIFGTAYQDAVALLMVMAISTPILFVASSVGATLVTQEHMKKKVKYMGIVAVVNIMLNTVLIPLYGAFGAAIATVLSNSVLLVIFYVAAQNKVFNSKGNENVAIN